MRSATWRHAVRIVLVLGLMPAPLAAFSYQGPRLEATYRVTSARPAAGSVAISFSFKLLNLESDDVEVESIVLGDLSSFDRPYATFDGGTLSGRGRITGTADATIPQSVFDRWQNGGPATLFVYTRTRDGNVRRNRVDAYRLSA